jgi:hypothetical protein
MIGLLTMKGLAEGPFHLETIVVADHLLITIVLIINLIGDTMTTAVVVHQAAMKTTRMSLDSGEPTGANEPARRDRRRHDDLVQREDVRRPAEGRNNKIHLSGSRLAKGKMKLLLATRAPALMSVITGT